MSCHIKTGAFLNMELNMDAHDKLEASLPSWDLSDLYPGTDSPAIHADLARAERRAQAFAAAYAGKLSTLSGAALAAAIGEYEAIEEILGRLSSYASLLFAADSSDAATGQFQQKISEARIATVGHLLFFTLELNQISEADLALQSTDPALAHYAPWLRDVRVFKPHELPEQIEKILLEKDVTGYSAWTRLFDETMAALKVDVQGEELSVSAALNQLSKPDRTLREAAGKSIGALFTRNIRLFSLITNTLAKDKSLDDNWRHYPRPGSFRNRANMVEDEVVDALVSAVSANYERLSHRYYTLKAKWLGLEKLQHWDRNAPLPGNQDRPVSWPQARDLVLRAYGAFSPELAAQGKKFFDAPWIDAALREGKSGGAFAHPTVPSVHPYLLVNYHGRPHDVMTLAHELGHGVHQILAAPNGYLMSGTPLTLAETASVFGEMLTFRAMLANETDPEQKRLMLAAKVEDMLNTVVRQTAFYQFETRLHDERRQGELLPERIGEIWLEVQRASLGPAFEFTPEYAVFWAYVPHFVHSPFYVYAYAFGDCLVNALYSVYQAGHPGFEQKYLDLLRAGGTKRHQELLAPFGLDASDPGFWTKGLDVISGFIDELEQD